MLYYLYKGYIAAVHLLVYVYAFIFCRKYKAYTRFFCGMKLAACTYFFLPLYRNTSGRYRSSTP